MKEKIIACLMILFAAFSPVYASDTTLVQSVDTTYSSEMAAFFSDVYENLNIIQSDSMAENVALESLQGLNPNIHIAATDERVILVWKDSIMGTWAKPNTAEDMGNVTVGMIAELKKVVPSLQSASDNQIYSDVLKSILSDLDINAVYSGPSESVVVDEDKVLTGIGLVGVRDEKGNFRVKGVYKDSPADWSGITENDLIVEINGMATSQFSEGDLLSEFFGANSGTLKLTIVNPDGQHKVVLRRATMVLADADIIVRKPVLEIVINKISNRSFDIVKEALQKHSDDIDGIILDLRAASGDDDVSVAKLAGLFMGSVPVMRITDSFNEETEIIPGGNRITDLPVVVVVSGATRGMAEVLALSFYENGRGVVIGTPTAGQVNVSRIINLKNGGQLKMFDGQVKSALGVSLSDRGVFPMVCLSTINSESNRMAFFANAINGDFNAIDFNSSSNIDIDKVRIACPQIQNGETEDAAASAVSVQMLTDGRVYKKLLKR